MGRTRKQNTNKSRLIALLPAVVMLAARDTLLIDFSSRADVINSVKRM
jgi:hypothetical protein